VDSLAQLIRGRHRVNGIVDASQVAGGRLRHGGSARFAASLSMNFPPLNPVKRRCKPCYIVV